MPMFEAANINPRPYFQQFLYTGQMFRINHRFIIENNATVYHQLITGLKIIHLLRENIKWQGGGGGPLVINILENSTCTTGNAIPNVLKNLDRRSSKEPELTYFTNPTAISGGTNIKKDLFLGSGTKLSAFVVNETFEFVLNSNSTYIIAFENETGQEVDAFIDFIGYSSEK